MHILLTGVNGLLGRSLPGELQDHHITALVRRLPESQIKGIEYLLCDLGQPLVIEKLPKKIDAVIHLAQSENYRNFPQQALDVFQINTACTASLLDYSLKAGAQTFFYASSGSVYEPFERSLNEDEALYPSSYYAVSKFNSEKLLSSYQAHLNVCAFRLFFLYGERVSNSLITSLVNRVREKTPILLDLPNGLTFTPTHVNDVARLIKMAMEKKWNGIINVASPEAVNLRELTMQMGVFLDQTPCYQTTEKNAQEIVPSLKKLQTVYPEMNFIKWRKGIEKLCLEN